MLSWLPFLPERSGHDHTLTTGIYEGREIGEIGRDIFQPVAFFRGNAIFPCGPHSRIVFQNREGIGKDPILEV